MNIALGLPDDAEEIAARIVHSVVYRVRKRYPGHTPDEDDVHDNDDVLRDVLDDDELILTLESHSHRARSLILQQSQC